MAIEKMVLVRIEGALKRVNKTLMKCCESKCFHIIPPSHGVEREWGERRLRSLKSKNPFAPIVDRARTLAEGLDIEIREVDYDDVSINVSVDFDSYYDEIEQKYAELSERKKSIEADLKDHSVALMQVERLSGFNIDFPELFACKYVKCRFGRLPLDSLPKLAYYNDRDFIYYHFTDENGYAQILYVTPFADSPEVDDIFTSLFFERTRVPDYFHGNADEAKSDMLKMVREENTRLEAVNNELETMRQELEDSFLKVTSKLIALDQSYFLRQNVAAINNKFFMSGYVPKRRLKEFIASVESVPDVHAEEKPLDSEPNSSPPVLLRNNWLFRPFEMFVKMYGLPNYKCFDPTPYVAVTFMLIFGIMFGDVGQGLLITVLGVILDKWRKVKLAPVMQRIGITSALFGVLYGSVFGNEELIEPFFKIPSVYQALGYAEAPADIFQVSTILLIVAIGIGVIMVLISMAMNIATNIRSPQWLSQAVINPNGFTGMIFYASLMVGIALQLGLGIEVMTTPYVLCLIVLPLALMFLKEPLIHLLNKAVKGKTTVRNINILSAVKTYSDSISELPPINGSEEMQEQLATSNLVKAQYGEMSMEAYRKLSSSGPGSFIFYPCETDGTTVTGAYITAVTDLVSVDRQFASLGFKKLKMPEHIEDIRKEQTLHLSDYTPAEQKEKKSVGNFIIEGIIELFESCLSYVTNTMSFLRIGGFILSHAGLMLVVSILAEKAGDSAIIVQILGNLFVVGMEGFLVGIQVLRLEFYEVFSRFYKGDGKPFSPVVANYSAED